MSKQKPVAWLGSSLNDLSDFPTEARRKIGFQLNRVQGGLEPDDWKPFGTVGAGVEELRVRAANNQYRCLYVARFEDVIYVLHCFVKKEQKTSSRDIEVAKQRYKLLISSRYLQ